MFTPTGTPPGYATPLPLSLYDDDTKLMTDSWTTPPTIFTPPDSSSTPDTPHPLTLWENYPRTRSRSRSPSPPSNVQYTNKFTPYERVQKPKKIRNTDPGGDIPHRLTFDDTADARPFDESDPVVLDFPSLPDMTERANVYVMRITNIKNNNYIGNLLGPETIMPLQIREVKEHSVGLKKVAEKTLLGANMFLQLKRKNKDTLIIKHEGDSEYKVDLTTSYVEIFAQIEKDGKTTTVSEFLLYSFIYPKYKGNGGIGIPTFPQRVVTRQRGTNEQWELLP
jgi:hypothetical protein